MFKFEATDVLHNIDVNALSNNYPVDWEALDNAGFRFDAYTAEKDGTEYLLIVAGRNVGLITRKDGVVEAIRVADDLQSRHALETAIERNLDWYFYEQGSVKATVQKPRAFLARLFGKKAPNIGELKQETIDKLAKAKKALAVAEDSIDRNAPDAAQAMDVLNGLKQVVNIMTDTVDAPEVIEAEVLEVKPLTLSQRVATINHNGLPRAERIEMMRSLLELEEYSTDPARGALEANLAPQAPVGTVELAEIATRKAAEAVEKELVLDKPTMEVVS